MTRPLHQRHWIFDLDGTLTVAVHDFAAIKAQLGLPAHLPVLEGIAAAPASDREQLLAGVAAWEWSLADAARPAPAAKALLAALPQPLGIVTRNRRDIALRTLEAAGLARWFDPADVLGRDDAAPKPAPDALLLLLRRWGVDPREAVFIGDHDLDVHAGRAAGTHAIHLCDGPGDPAADQVVSCLSELLPTT